MIFLKFAFCIFSILVSGYTILRLFFYPKERLPFGEIIILSFGIGTGFVGLEFFSLALIKKPISVSYLLLFQIILLIFALFKFKKNFFYWQASYKQQKFIYTPLAILFLSVILWEIIYVFLGAFSLPFTAWDAWGNWGFKAKIFFIEKGVPFELFTQLPWIKYPPAHPDYPLLVPFVESYIYFFLGQVHEPLIKLFCSFYYIGIIALFYYHLKKQFINSFALWNCFCLATIPNLVNIASTGYIEIPLTFYISCSILYIWRFLKEKDNSALLLGSLFAALAMWTKNEGVSFYVALFLSCILISLLFDLNINKKIFLFIVLFIPLLIFFPWILLRFILGIKTVYFGSSFDGFFNLAKQRLPLILDIWLRNGLDIQKWNIFWIGFVVSLIWFFIRSGEKLSIFFILIIAFQLIFYFIIYIIWPETIEYVRWQILNSVDRLPVHLIPIALFFICQQLGKKWTRQ